jgi:hypothetical protein
LSRFTVVRRILRSRKQKCLDLLRRGIRRGIESETDFVQFICS